MIRLALAAPSAMLLAGLEALLGGDGAHVVVERATPLDSLGDVLEGAEIDVVVAVVDDARRFTFAGRDGGDAIPIVVLADREGGASTGEWLRRGARAVLGRDAEPREIHAAIDAVAAGLAVVPAGESLALAGEAPRTVPRLARRVDAALQPLSPREREILALMAEGLVNKIIAARLGISEHTVKTHVASIFAKLDVETRAEAVAVGARSGALIL